MNVWLAYFFFYASQSMAVVVYTVMVFRAPWRKRERENEIKKSRYVQPTGKLSDRYRHEIFVPINNERPAER